MGISMQNVTEQIQQMYGMPKGVFIFKIESGSAADMAGLKKGDIIVKFDGARISTSSDLEENMQYYKAGDTATITVKRVINGEYETVEVEITLGKRPENK